uniref:Uncharacterized protein n=1 Tax=Plectus sambesii TaxID=2011161 RepID=A0A914WGQ4_9BILA
MMSEEKVRLDYLVVAMCVAHMRQGFIDCIRQEQVSRQFATALKSVLGKRPVSMTILSFMNILNIEIEYAASDRSVLRHEDALSSKRNINFYGCDLDTNKLLLSIAPHFKELTFKGNFSIGSVASKQLWDTISKFSQLRHLSIPSIDYSDLLGNSYSETDVLSCLKVLKLKSFEADGSGLFLLFDSETILSTFQDNSNLRRLSLGADTELLSSPLVAPILSNLHHLSIEAIFDRIRNPIAENHSLMSDIRFILQSLPDNAVLCMKVHFVGMEDEEAEQLLSCVKIVLDMSNTAKKPIRLIFGNTYCPLRYPDVYEMADLIEDQEWFRPEVEDKNLFKVERVNRTCVVSGNDAKVIISIVNEEFMY